MNEHAQEQFGEYRLNRSLGAGSFAEVYEAEQIHSGKQVAIKLYRGFIRQAQGDFLKEARIAAGLEHPHIVKVFTFGVEQDIPYLVMGYAPNGSLDKLYPIGTRLPLSLIVSYVKQIADALQYAHEQKRVIHRDIKPANLLLGENEQVLVGDFGIAEIAHSTFSWEEQKVAGTYIYMAPEQFRAKAKPASDQYSLGIVVYQWLCGEPPFKGTIYTLPLQHETDPPPPLREKIPISPAVEAVVLKALAKNPQQRFPNVQGFADALEQAYIEEIKTLLTTPEHPWDLLMQEDVLYILLDLIVSDPDWWNNDGRAAINNLRTQAIRESRTAAIAMLSALAKKAANRAGNVIQRGDDKAFVNLLGLVYSAAPPSTDPSVWTFLLESLSANSPALTFVNHNSEIHSWLLRQWGNAPSSVENRLIRLWFPRTWPELWRFLELPLPEEWHDMALTDLLDTSLANPLPAPIIRSIEQEYASQLEDFLRQPPRSSDRQSTTLRLFTKLVESGYTKKMNILDILLIPHINPTKDFVEMVLGAAQLTEQEIAMFLEKYGKIQLYYQLPIVLDYARQYLLAFNPNDLERLSARQLLQFISNNPSLPLDQELRVQAENWHNISAFIDQPEINNQVLLALTRTIYQLPPSTRSTLMDKLVTSCIPYIESEIDLMCVIYTMNTVLAEPELPRFLYQMANIVGEEYKRRRSEAILVPYIRIVLQVETILGGISKADQHEFVIRFLSTLLQYANRETYKKLNPITQSWPTRISARWHDYTSNHNPQSTSAKKRRWPYILCW